MIVEEGSRAEDKDKIEDTTKEEVVVENETIGDKVEEILSWSVAPNIKDSIYGKSVLRTKEAMPTKESTAEEEDAVVVVIREEAMSSCIIYNIKHTSIYHCRQEWIYLRLRYHRYWSVQERQIITHSMGEVNRHWWRQHILQHICPMYLLYKRNSNQSSTWQVMAIPSVNVDQ